MNRKRLMTILAATTTAVALQVGPAAALDSGLGDAVEGTVDKTTETVEDTVDKTTDTVEGTVDKTTDAVEDTVDKTTDTVDETTDAAEDVVEETADTVEETADAATGGSDDSSDGGGSDSGSSSGSSSDSGSSSSGSGGSSSGGESTGSSGGDVSTAGEADSAPEPTDQEPTQAMQRLSGYEFSSSSGPGGVSGADVGGDVSPAFDLADLSGDFDLEEPLIAAPESGPSTEPGDEVPAPESAAPSDPREPEQAELVTAAPATEGEGAVPAALKLLAASLVAGTGAIWHVARREVGLR